MNPSKDETVVLHYHQTHLEWNKTKGCLAIWGRAPDSKEWQTVLEHHPTKKTKLPLAVSGVTEAKVWNHGFAIQVNEKPFYPIVLDATGPSGVVEFTRKQKENKDEIVVMHYDQAHLEWNKTNGKMYMWGKSRQSTYWQDKLKDHATKKAKVLILENVTNVKSTTYGFEIRRENGAGVCCYLDGSHDPIKKDCCELVCAGILFAICVICVLVLIVFGGSASTTIHQGVATLDFPLASQLAMPLSNMNVMLVMTTFQKGHPGHFNQSMHVWAPHTTNNTIALPNEIHWRFKETKVVLAIYRNSTLSKQEVYHFVLDFNNFRSRGLPGWIYHAFSSLNVKPQFYFKVNGPLQFSALFWEN